MIFSLWSLWYGLKTPKPSRVAVRALSFGDTKVSSDADPDTSALPPALNFPFDAAFWASNEMLALASPARPSLAPAPACADHDERSASPEASRSMDLVDTRSRSVSPVLPRSSNRNRKEVDLKKRHLE